MKMIKAACVVLALMGSLQIRAELRMVELAIETSLDRTVLPSGPNSTLVVTPCGGCEAMALPATARSRYFLGREQVSLTEFKRRLETRPKAMLVVLYRKDSREISRIIARAN